MALIEFLANLVKSQAVKDAGELLLDPNTDSADVLDAVNRMGGLEEEMFGPDVGAEGLPPLPGTGGSPILPEAKGGQIPGLPVIPQTGDPGGYGNTYRHQQAPLVPREITPAPRAIPDKAIDGGINQAGPASGLLPPTESVRGVESDVSERTTSDGSYRKERHGLLGKYINTMDKINAALNATPLLGNYLRGSSQEYVDELMDIKRTGVEQRELIKMYDEMQENIRHAEAMRMKQKDIEAKREIGRERVEAMDRGTKADLEIAADRDVTSMIEMFDLASDETRELLRQKLERKGISVPKAEEGGNWLVDLIKGAGAKIDEVKEAWNETFGDKKVKDDPLELF